MYLVSTSLKIFAITGQVRRIFVYIGRSNQSHDRTQFRVEIECISRSFRTRLPIINNFLYIIRGVRMAKNTNIVNSTLTLPGESRLKVKTLSLKSLESRKNNITISHCIIIPINIKSRTYFHYVW